jgi:UDP-N-acetylglucosamine acyltransferase
MSIHPTAIIDPSAQLDPDVEIGPYCVVGAGVVMEAGCQLQNHVTICGRTHLGPRNKFFPYSSIGQQSQDLKYQAEPTYLKIGSDNTFREFVTVNRGTTPGSSTLVGSHNNFLAYSHIAHDCIVGDHCIFSNNGTLAGHVVVGDHVILGGFSAVHQFCRIGNHAITGGCTKIVKDVAPYMLVDGNPAETRSLNLVGLQRRGFSEQEIRALKEAYKCLHLRKLNHAQALEQMEVGESIHVAELRQFYLDSKRGVT